jgi:hypothetical protein
MRMVAGVLSDDIASHSARKLKGKQKVVRMGIQGSKQTCVKALSCGSGVAPSQTVVRAELWATTVPTMPNLIESPPDYAFWCFPHASPVSTSGAGKQEAAPDDRFKPLISLSKFGAGEGIRTLDPNLGKVAILIARGGATASARRRCPRQVLPCDSDPSHVREQEHRKTPFEKPF